MVGIEVKSFNPFKPGDWKKLGDKIGDKADKAGDEIKHNTTDILDEIPELVEDTIHEIFKQIQSQATKEIVKTLIDLGELAAPKTLAEVPVIPSTPFSPGIGVAIQLKESIRTLKKYYNHPPHNKNQYMRMLRDLVGDQNVLILLPGGNGKISVSIDVIEKQIEKLI